MSGGDIGERCGLRLRNLEKDKLHYVSAASPSILAPQFDLSIHLSNPRHHTSHYIQRLITVMQALRGLRIRLAASSENNDSMQPLEPVDNGVNLRD